MLINLLHTTPLAIFKLSIPVQNTKRDFTSSFCDDENILTISINLK